MRFQTKIIIGYTLLAIGTAMVLGISYYRFSLMQYERNEENNMEVISQQITSQMEEVFKTMELTTHYILSDSRMLTAIRILAEAEEKQIEESYQKESIKDIQAGIRTDYIVNSFYRTIVFNRTNSAVATTNVLSKRNATPEALETLEWLKRADEQYGRPVIANSHEDTWGLEHNPQVFSLVKAVHGKNMGYIEVQKKTEDLEELIQLPKEGLQIAIFVNGTELLYSNVPIENKKELDELVRQNGNYVTKYDSRIEGNEKLIAKTQSHDYELAIVLQQDTTLLRQETKLIASMTALIAAVFFGISMIFVILISTIITKPIRELRKVMENTRMDNLRESFVHDSAIDEIKALNASFHNVLERLQVAMLKEKKMAMLQLQSQFDTLQSQVNPHFLYNVLNIISARGMTNQDEEICRMCACLASMLRYSTNTKTRYATVGEEVEYVKQYYYLQKARFKHKIDFQFEVSDEIQKEILPKMTLQQLVENCMNHGFEHTSDQMQIWIKGWQEKGNWYCSIRDNGEGIEEETLTRLNDLMKQTKIRILKLGENIELEIGGMGLLNTYSRLLLLYQEEVEFRIESSQNGTEIVIAGGMRKEQDQCFE